ncbi:hypothetical protein Phi10:1_gp046 [Cellulophaga phage phi10:1]|uniref:Uncharacterized protein n=1 Tax=Cellulophaga phage phi10:1 TaxID=1327981 RepID=S0A1M0_9CAUD|nr:hypothetical protein Phi10:1_gp046 [Cellulophaga phage phi10:1]AGO48387.1 hypothetical protein Phi10:1_gp046 [Cellulophaga phage phi10:1]
MKLELKDLACYLPYDLKIKTGDYIRTLSISITTTTEISLSNVLCDIGYKPILRPLSDLSKKKQIAEYYCSFFDHLERINSSTKDTQNCALMLDGSIEFHYWNDYQFLLEHHFDIFGLIEKGLAIDINTLND